jgi:hypothetical protein
LITALVQVLLADGVSVQITVYNPTYTAASGFRYVLTAGASALGANPAVVVEMANVWAGWLTGAAAVPGALPGLNHWVLVEQVADSPGSAAARQGNGAASRAAAGSGSAAVDAAAAAGQAEAGLAAAAAAASVQNGKKRGAEPENSDNRGAKRAA